MSSSRTITVWAPRAQEVAIVLHPESGAPPGAAGRRMNPQGDGWWSYLLDPGAEEPAGGRLDYAFVLDGSQPALPDPRSAWQPDGVHGRSRLFDPDAFAWTDSEWRGSRGGAGVLGAVIYELHVGTFTAEGTLDAAIERLDGLVDLGVDLVQLLPVAAFPGRWGWGYDGVALYAVHDAYGGPEALQRFVDAAHARGLGVCLDVVYNHLGPSGNYLSRFGPYFTDRHETPWGEAVNLDGPGSGPVRRFILDNALRWLRDFHLDALRLDAVHELKDDSGRHLLAELSDEVAALATKLGRPLDLIAESDLNDVRMVTPTAQGGQGMTAQWDDDVHHALHTSLTGESHGYYGDFAGGAPGHPQQSALAVLAKVLTDGFLHDGSHSSFRGRAWGAPIDRSSFDGRRLLAYLQTHDQVGNRALGDRISALLPPGRQAIGAALYLLGPFTPMIFAGEEWATSSPWLFFTSFEDDSLAEAVRAGRRAEFAGHGWSATDIPDPQAGATRDASVLRWEERERPEGRAMLQWYARLIALRREHVEGPTHLDQVAVELDEAAGWLVLRHSGLVVAANLGATAVTVPLAQQDEPTIVLSRGLAELGPAQDSPRDARADRAVGLTLGPDGIAVLRSRSVTD